MRTTIFHRPAADLCAVELEGVQWKASEAAKAVRARRGASQAFFEEMGDRLGPSDSVVTPEVPGVHNLSFLSAQARRYPVKSV